VANHRSINEPVELSMIAVDKDRPAARAFDLLNEQVLTVAGIYGPNASGKSNVLDALSWLAFAVATSLRSWDERIPREPFKFGGAENRPSRFDVEMMVRGVRYGYTVELGERGVSYEALFSYPARRRRLLFERQGLEIEFRRGLGRASGTRELLTPATLALSAAMHFQEPEIMDFGRELAGMGTYGARPAGRLVSSRWRAMRLLATTLEPGLDLTNLFFFDRADPRRPQVDSADSDAFGTAGGALAMLRFADLGIEDVQVDEDTNDMATERRTARTIRLVHRAADEQVAFDLGDESEGTRTWFKLIGPVLRVLSTGEILLFDEIDASLHPRLSAKLLELFHDPRTNPHGAQLIFTSHDTSLLNHLNRDEVWLTEKDHAGATTLTALAEYGGDKVRRSLNLERAYLQGRFGAVPEIDQVALKAALGLAVKEG
jgi:hypothetical protein